MSAVKRLVTGGGDAVLKIWRYPSAFSSMQCISFVDNLDHHGPGFSSSLSGVMGLRYDRKNDSMIDVV